MLPSHKRAIEALSPTLTYPALGPLINRQIADPRNALIG
jgi:hypothetical protein